MQALDASTRLGADFSLESTLLSLLLAFVLGQVIAWTYAWTHSGLSYSRSFTQSLVLMTIVVALVMFIIGNSIVTAFGLLGALALIRFRNVLKDTRDTVFVFASLVVGMAVGTQRFQLADLGTAALLLVVVYLSKTSFGTLGQVRRLPDAALVRDRPGPRRIVGNCWTSSAARSSRSRRGRPARKRAPSSSTRSGCGTGNDPDELLEELRQLEGVTHVSLVLRSELSEV